MPHQQDQLEETTTTKHTLGDRTQARAAAERIRERARKLKLVHFDWESLKADRDTGRP